jgi:ferrous iron transport protein A
MSAAVKLSQLTLGASARVRDFPKNGAVFVRLREMGLLPGTSVTFIRSAPLGDPIEIKVRGYHLTLRREEAEQITVDTESLSAPPSVGA